MSLSVNLMRVSSGQLLNPYSSSLNLTKFLQSTLGWCNVVNMAFSNKFCTICQKRHKPYEISPIGTN